MRHERIASLKRQHSQLENDLAGLRAVPSADIWYIQALKRQKLFIKDQLFGAAARQNIKCRPS